jgi:DNA-binding response OmpR family regulator
MFRFPVGRSKRVVGVDEEQMKSNLKQVLLVGQQGVLIRLVTEKLHSIGYQVIYAADPATAIYEAQSKRFDLYIFDEDQQDDTGLEMCQAFRLFDSATPILLFAEEINTVSFQKALRSGAQWLLKKPVDPYHLIPTAVRLVCQAESRPRTRRSAWETNLYVQNELKGVNCG